MYPGHSSRGKYWPCNHFRSCRFQDWIYSIWYRNIGFDKSGPYLVSISGHISAPHPAPLGDLCYNWSSGSSIQSHLLMNRSRPIGKCLCVLTIPELAVWFDWIHIPEVPHGRHGFKSCEFGMSLVVRHKTWQLNMMLLDWYDTHGFHSILSAESSCPLLYITLFTLTDLAPSRFNASPIAFLFV